MSYLCLINFIIFEIPFGITIREAIPREPNIKYALIFPAFNGFLPSACGTKDEVDFAGFGI